MGVRRVRLFRRPNRPRWGFSLLEIMAAMAICVLGLAVILQMSSLSQRFALKAENLVEQEVACENRINEILAGIRPPQNVTNLPCPENERLVFSIHVEPQDDLPLALLEVVVQPQPPAGQGSAPPVTAGDSANRRSTSRSTTYRLRRWIDLPAGGARDPQLPAHTVLKPAPEDLPE